MADPVRIGGLIHLPPDDTARAFDQRGELRTTVKWHEMWQEEHARAFTVAKVANLDLLDTIRNSLADALANGATFEHWKERILPDLQRAGWWGRVEDKALTGTSQPVYVGPRRLETIYRTNMRVSRAAGQWSRIQDRKDVAPYLRYSAVLDSRTRPAHRAWHGTILPVDDPWWETHFPPCGWNCRCNAIQLSERDLRANGWSVSKAPPPEGPPSSFWRAGAPEPVSVPAGIDPGWAYNPGAASLRAISERAGATLSAIAADDPEGAFGALLGFARDPSADFIVRFGMAGAESGADVAGYARGIAVSEVRHILRLHGADSDDPFPLLDDDLKRIPAIVATGRRIDQQRKHLREQVFVLEEDGMAIVYVERVGGKARRLLGRTLFKRPIVQLPQKYKEGGR